MKLPKLALIIQAFCALSMQRICAQVHPDTATITMEGTSIGVAWGFSYGYEGSPSEVFLPQVRKMGMHLTKLYLFWQQIEPAKGQYDWEAIDTYLNQLKPNDEALLAVFSTSAWATKVAAQTLPPSPAKSLDEYYQFIYQLVKHCQGKIKYWQNDCEPNNPVYWSGSDDEFIAQLKVFYRAVKDADPRAQVVLGGYDGLFNPPGMWVYPGQEHGLAFFTKTIKEASDYFDIFDMRLYADPYTIPARVQYFKQILADSGQSQPMICTEYNGPGFFEFPANLKYIDQIVALQQAAATLDTTVLNRRGKDNPVAIMYDSMSTLDPQTQMFMIECSEDLDDKDYRLQCRDMVMRNVLALSAGVQKTMYWDLWHNTEDRDNLMTLMFGKNKLVEYENGKIMKTYPQAAALQRIANYLNTAITIKQINIPNKESLYFFEITRTDKAPLYVVWERRDAFSGENDLATPYELPWTTGQATATDIFGNVVPCTSAHGNLNMDISLTPIFIEIVKNKKL